MSQTTKFIAVLRNKRLSTLTSLRYRTTNSNHPAGQLNKPNDLKRHPPRFNAHGLGNGHCFGNGHVGCRSFYSQTDGAASTGSMDRRVFAPYTIFKGKSALSISPVLPKFRKLDSGGHQLDRRGVIMMTFWPAIGERKYDWDKRQMFALSATEVGSLLSLGPLDSCEFFHDPSMKTSNAGQVRKSLSIKANAESSGYFFSLSVSNNITKATERLTVPLTTAEFAVIRAASGYALPHILGWNHITNQPLAGASDLAKSAPLVKDLEWDR